ncbi:MULTISPECIES: hypothetical protein [Sorangium]|uniref:hypothetical protein n=1 Tax=Sorangium TaxID=39643 RepID=UPI003D9C579E
MSLHRFRRVAPSAWDLQASYLPPGVTVTVHPLVPEQTCDFELSDDGALEDLKQGLSKEWEYVGPAEPPEGG